MASVVFLRGVNLGRHKSFQPSAVARELAHLDAISIGAAGTFVIRKAVGQAALRAEVLRRLPFETELMICRGADLLALRDSSFPGRASGAEVARYVSVLARRPRQLPRLPLTQPAGDGWQVKVVAFSGPFALSLHRRMGRTLVYPNEVVEKHLGVPATTRNWTTIMAVRTVLDRA